jgi:hypothetical protein
MANLKHKVKTALDESRMLILGASVLLGFQYRAPFEPGFASLAPASQYLKMAGLWVLLIAIALIMSPGSYHRIVWEGNDSRDLHDFTTTVMDVALLPFLFALGLDFYVVVGRLLGSAGGVAAGTMTAAGAFLFWYGPALTRRKRNSSKERGRKTEMEETPLKDKVEQVLTEARVVLPGVQALLGFQLATMLMEGFDKLPTSSRYVHLISLLLMALCVILLMTPAAYHRMVERGEDTERFHRVASALLLSAMLPLPLGICGDLYVVFRKATGSVGLSIGSAILMLTFFYGLWFGYTAYRRAQLTAAT